jgi:hypothetical protein
MPNQRKPGKKKIGVWVTDEEQSQINAELKKHGMKNVAELLKAIREGRVKVSPHVQALVAAAVGSSQSGCGPLFALVILGAVVALAFL